jgi:hypothetical protein
MRDADPSGGFQQQQRYFFQIKMQTSITLKPNRLNDSSDKSQNDEFFFDAAAKRLLLQTQLLR